MRFYFLEGSLFTICFMLALYRLRYLAGNLDFGPFLLWKEDNSTFVSIRASVFRGPGLWTEWNYLRKFYILQ